MTRACRMIPIVRCNQCFLASMHVAEKMGYSNFTLQDIATEANVSRATVAHYLGHIGAIRDRIVSAALRHPHTYPRVAAEAVLARHPAAAELSHIARKNIIDSVVNSA